MSVKELQTKREQRTILNLVSALAELCAGDPKRIIDDLTGYLWDEEEAGQIKTANNRIAGSEQG